MYSRLFISSILAVILILPCLAQKQKGESYRKLKSRASTTGIEQLLGEAENLKVKNPDAALDKIQEALAMSVAEQDTFNEGRAYILLAQINEGILEWKLAFENYARAKEKLTNAYSPQYLTVLSGLGNSSLKLRNYDEALRYYQEALSMKLTASERMQLQIALSEVYYQMGNYSEAAKALGTATDSKKVINPELENQRTKIQARLNELNNAPNLYDNSLNSIRSGKPVSEKEKQSVQDTKEEIADVLQSQKRYDDEISLRKQSIEYNLESKNLTEVSKDKVAISKSLDAKGELNAAIREAEEATRLSDSIDSPSEKANAFLSLANLYDKNGQSGKAITAYKNYSKAIAAQEKLSQEQLMEKSELIRKQKDIEEFISSISIGQREETIEQATVFRQQLIIYGLLSILLIVSITSFFIYKNARASKLANRLLALKSLRGQMNPHFIFNALNSVNQFISQQDERTANRFLSEFALLMRLVLENSQEDFIPLQKEQEILSLYLKLEHYRFRDKFDYEIKVDDNVNTDAIDIPPMLIQPYIENAVWHGLRYKNEKGKLLLHFYRQNGSLVIEVSDDGIGRKKSAELKTANQMKHTSTGLKNIEERLAIINKVYQVNYRVQIEDRPENGTSVRVILPLNKSNNS